MLLSRREFLRIVGVCGLTVAGASLAVACTPAAPTGSAPVTADSAAEPATQEDAVTVTYWDWWAPTWGPIYADFFEYVNAAAAEHVENIALDVQHVPFDQYVPKLQASHASGTPPDVLHVSRNWARDFYDQGLLHDMAPFQEITGDLSEDTFLPGSLVQAQKENVLYGIPGEGPDSLQIFYNIDMFEEAGIDPSPEAVKTWDWETLVLNAKKLTQYEGEEVTVSGFLVGMPWFGDHPAAWAGCHGGSFYRDGQAGVAFNDNDAAVHGLEWRLRMLYDEKVSQPLSPERRDREIFMQKRAAMVNDGPWSYSTVQEGAPDIRLGAMILPAWPGEGGQQSTAIWNNMLSIPSQAAHKEAGWNFLSWWCSLDFMLDRLRIGDWLAPRKDFYETPEFDAKLQENPVLATVPYASEMGTPAPYTQLTAMEPHLRATWDAVMLQQAEPAPAVEQLVETCNQILAEAGYA